MREETEVKGNMQKIIISETKRMIEEYCKQIEGDEKNDD